MAICNSDSRSSCCMNYVHVSPGCQNTPYSEWEWPYNLGLGVHMYHTPTFSGFYVN